MVSIKDVAKHAGVAISTVSKVLNNYPNISEATRKKVNAAVEELNFVPNSVAAALSSKNAGRVALMIDLNVTSLHILTKLFYTEFVKKDKGQILNVASIAAFQPGPLMATYYASKAYVYNLTMALYEENRRNKGNVKISVLCPGPAETGFFDRANVKFSIKPHTSDFVTDYAIKKMMKNKLLIIPGFIPKMTVFANRFVPRKIAMKIAYKIQNRKLYKEKK